MSKRLFWFPRRAIVDCGASLFVMMLGLLGSKQVAFGSTAKVESCRSNVSTMRQTD
jgi:hypothetical protein